MFLKETQQRNSGRAGSGQFEKERIEDLQSSELSLVSKELATIFYLTAQKRYSCFGLQLTSRESLAKFIDLSSDLLIES